MKLCMNPLWYSHKTSLNVIKRCVIFHFWYQNLVPFSCYTVNIHLEKWSMRNWSYYIATKVCSRKSASIGGYTLAGMTSFATHAMLQYVQVTGSKPDDTGSRLMWFNSHHARTCACIEHTSHKSNQMSAHTYLLLLGSSRTILGCLSLILAEFWLRWPHLPCDL